MARDPRLDLLFMSPELRAAYGQDFFSNLPEQAGFPPEGIPTVFLRRADIARHHEGPLPTFTPQDWAGEQRLREAFLKALVAAGVPDELIGAEADGRPLAGEFSGAVIKLSGQSILDQNAVALSMKPLSVVLLYDEPPTVAQSFATLGLIAPADMPDLGAVGRLKNPYHVVIHEGRHLVQPLSMDDVAEEADADEAFNKAHPGLKAVLADARALGSLHHSLQGSVIRHHVGFYNGAKTEGVGSEAVRQIGYHSANAVFGALVDVIRTQHLHEHYDGVVPDYDPERMMMLFVLQQQLKEGTFLPETRDVLERAYSDLDWGADPAEVMERLKTEHVDEAGRPIYRGNFNVAYNQANFEAELMGMGPRELAPLVSRALGQSLDVVADTPGVDRADVLLAGRQYLEAAGRRYPELAVYQTITAPASETVEIPAMQLPEAESAPAAFAKPLMPTRCPPGPHAH